MTGSWNTNEYKINQREVTFISSSTGATQTYACGDLVDNTYKLVRFLGQGGMGVVFACQHIGLGKDFAIKILADENLSEEAWHRFQAEARALAKLNHPGIVGIHNMFVDSGRFPYYVMDLLDGHSLDALIKAGGPLEPGQALDIFILVADALSAAHLQGIVHRDVKPSNIMLMSDNGAAVKVKIVDFGIARLSTHNLANQSQTKTGQVFGTPFYMSPEQCQGARVDLRTDIYSLGCSLFEALTGAPPFRGENAFQTFLMHQSEAPPLLSKAAPGRSFPDGLDQFLCRTLAKSADDRYQSMAQLKQDLERLKAGKTIKGQTTVAALAANGIRGQSGPTSESMSESMEQYRQSKRLPDGGVSAKTEEADKPRSLAGVALISLAAVSLIGAGVFAFIALSKPAKPADQSLAGQKPLPEPIQYSHIGAPGDMEEVTNFDFTQFHIDEKKMLKLLDKYFKNPATAKAPFRTTGNREGFLFPKDFYMAALSINHETPFLVSGFVSVPKSQRVCLYLFSSTFSRPEILDKFGADDINGLEVLTDRPDTVLSKIKHWYKLDELSFFNDLIKKPGKSAMSYEESLISDKNLPAIDKLTTLRSLGLCGPKINGAELVKMKLFKSLDCLKVKRIEGVDALLNALPARDNIKELWLVDQMTTDEQLEPLTRMKNLEELWIRTSQLTAKSSPYFKRMRSLKHLHLDRDWESSEKEQFKKDVPVYEYEYSIDSKYWQVFPNKNNRLSDNDQKLEQVTSIVSTRRH